MKKAFSNIKGKTLSIEKLETLHEQTSFLLKKQQELLEESLAAFDSVLSLVDEKKATTDMQDKQDKQESESSGSLEDLQFIYNYITKQKEVLNEPIQQDIDFLNDQLKAIKKIIGIEDPEKVKELLDMMLEEDASLLETNIFKEQVSKDFEESKKDLDVMINDLKDAVNEGNWHTLKLTLEAMESTQEDDACCDSNCSSCEGCSGDSGVDIFDALKDLESDDKKS
jgi:hypothetical protein